MARTIFDGDGATAPAVRRAAGDRGGEVPPALVPLIDKIRRHAYKVTDDDIAAARAAGYSEDQLFEIIIATALGVALGRLDRALAAVDGETSRPGT